MGGGRDHEAFARRIEEVVAELDGVERRETGEGTEILVAGRVIALYGQSRVEVRLDPIVASAAVRTPDASASDRGSGWVLFAPANADRFVLDRTEAWLRSAYRLAAGD